VTVRYWQESGKASKHAETGTQKAGIQKTVYGQRPRRFLR
jgi:hypothetical protein